jgi:hypothetical protein
LSRASLADALLISHYYPDELALGSLRLRKLAAADREIDLLLPFGAAGMRRDGPNSMVGKMKSGRR